MIDSFKNLDKAGKIRLILFVCILIWCLYWGVGFSYEISRGGGLTNGLSSNMVDVSDILGVEMGTKVTLLGQDGDEIITADDMMINIISYQFANNYSNINLPGYLYIKRKVSMSRGGGRKLKNLRAKNYIFYFKLFYKYIKDYNKDINILYYEMKDLEYSLLKIKKYIRNNG